ncbi:MAG TPA: HAMP domain-containing histidine kinase [Anaerolineae bacterium]|nr:HAMP domain-containing histidine kinase [Anaerolineae bacterium]
MTLTIWFVIVAVGGSIAFVWFIWRLLPNWRAVLVVSVLWGMWLIGTIALSLWLSLWTWGLQSAAFLATIGLLIRVLSLDTRQRAEIARLRRVAEMRGDRMSALSHEVRTPLAIIKGAAELLLDNKPGPLTPQQRTFLETIAQNCERVITLAEDLLVQARIEAGLFKLNLQPVDVKALTRQVVRNMRLLVAEKGQTITIDYPQVVPRIQADPRLLVQALTNLLYNASRYTSQGGHIYISVAENDESLVISVTDDGAGMSAEERRKLFQKFASGQPLGDGTGLGLVIVKLIVELHGGRILVDTSLGQGTTFLFTLPKLVDGNRVPGG